MQVTHHFHFTSICTYIGLDVIFELFYSGVTVVLHLRIHYVYGITAIIMNDLRRVCKFMTHTDTCGNASRS
jgi:hypothetical protein